MAGRDRRKEADSSMENMMSNDPEVAQPPAKECHRKRHFKDKIIEMVKHSENKFSLGIGYRIFSQKLGRTIKQAGYELGEILSEMDAAGEIFLYIDENYSRLVMVPEMREHYKLGIIGEETEETRNFIKAKWGRKPRGRAQ